MRLFIILWLMLNISCSYIKNAVVQAEYKRIHQTDPSMLNLKHMIEQETFFVYGKLLDSKGLHVGHELSIVAFSSRFKANEMVDEMRQLTPNTHFGLALPPGSYDLVIFADLNNNSLYESSEVVGRAELLLVKPDYGSNLIANVDIRLGPAETLEWPVSLEAKKAALIGPSLFYPPGTLRELADPLFDSEMSTLGMYHPAAFLDRARTMFYALEEEIGYKIPVVFIHGIGGSARDFAIIIEQLDRTYFKPWFFYYPSGGDLDQMAHFFYNIFLSGKVIEVNPKIPAVIVAHSMGGLIAREALNWLDSSQQREIHFFSMATPFGGHPAAASGETSGLIVLPSWRDLNPANTFIRNLYRKPLPPLVSHRLMYAYGNPKNIKLGENSDGIVPLASQLHETAQQQATEQIGFNTSHAGILRDSGAIGYLLNGIHDIKIKYPEEHMHYLLQGGFDVPLDSRYTKFQIYLIRTYGKYTRALISNRIKPADRYQEQFLEVIEGKRKPENELHEGWLMFLADYPNWSELD